MNRVKPLMKRTSSNPTYNMKLLMDNLSPSEIVPLPDKYYVFVYKAKTKGIQYDQYPFIVCTSVFPWGFTGYNFHWEESRRYTWREVLTNIHQIHDEELNDMMKFPIKSIKSN
jgi:hypothetical protein